MKTKVIEVRKATESGDRKYLEVELLNGWELVDSIMCDDAVYYVVSRQR